MFTSDRQPDPEDRVPRGKSKKNMILEAIKLETGNDGVEFLRKVIRIGLGSKDSPAVPMILSEAIKRIQPPIKPVMECVNLDISNCKTDAEKAVKVLSAVAIGNIPPDVGQMLIGMIKDSILITESTELLERLEALEAAIEASNKK
jgi:hypothetical protein